MSGLNFCQKLNKSLIETRDAIKKKLQCFNFEKSRDREAYRHLAESSDDEECGNNIVNLPTVEKINRKRNYMHLMDRQKIEGIDTVEAAAAAAAIDVTAMDDKKLMKKTSSSKKLLNGQGLEKEFIPYTNNIVYEYYNDYNKLCERLKLLISSKLAGNSNHDQEINSIINELRTNNIIM